MLPIHSEVKRLIRDNHIGRFRITREQLMTPIADIALAWFLLIDASHVYNTTAELREKLSVIFSPVVELTAYHEQFCRCPAGEEPPLYEINARVQGGQFPTTVVEITRLDIEKEITVVIED